MENLSYSIKVNNNFILENVEVEEVSNKLSYIIKKYDLNKLICYINYKENSKTVHVRTSFIDFEKYVYLNHILTSKINKLQGGE